MLQPGDVIELRALRSFYDGMSFAQAKLPNLRVIWITAVVEDVEDVDRVIARYRDPDTGLPGLACISLEPQADDVCSWRWPDPNRKN